MGDQETLYIIESIVEKKFSTSLNCWTYQIKWEGFSSEENTWEPEENLRSVPGLLDRFNAEWEKKEEKLKEQQKKKLERLAKQRQRRQEKRKAETPGKIQTTLDEGEPRKRKKADPPKDLKELVNNSPPDSPEKSEGSKSPFQNEKSGMENENSSQEETQKNPEEEKVDFEEELNMSKNEGDENKNPDENIQKAKEFTYKFEIENDKGDFSNSEPAKILGCRKLSGDVYYAVLFKVRKDGTIPSISLIPHKEMVANAPKMLSDYLLENLIAS
ncbi:unnamed protein product [Blepharisma stoltei]|uniref:Chromo domain-containing protein n=1 Tax=Blepharisma stoltei TaxID=1481888 RepID=A0AAU9IGX0_9CILI|nr:unnamed protein product [Blepharisma stoltei]